MLKAIIGDPTNSMNVNSRSSLIAAIYLGIVGPAIFIVQPGFVQGLVEYYGFSEKQAGYVASAEMWGIAISTFALIFISKRINWQHILVGAVLIAAIGNLLSTTTIDVFGFAALRALTGIGSGVLISLSFTIIGLTSNPDRNFGFLIMWILVYGAIVFLLMPLAYSSIGMGGLLLFFALLNLSCLAFIRYLPASGTEHAKIDAGTIDLPKMFKAMAVATLFIYFVAQGVVWAYLFLIGIEGNATEQQVSNGLTLSQFFGIAGALTAAIVANRYGRIPPLVLGITGSVVSLFLLFGQSGSAMYAIAVCIFNYAWNMTHPFLLAALASFDRTGQIVVYGVAGQMLGLAVGPALAASVVAENDYSNVIWLGIILFVVSLLTFIPPVLNQRQV